MMGGVIAILLTFIYCQDSVARRSVAIWTGSAQVAETLDTSGAKPLEVSIWLLNVCDAVLPYMATPTCDMSCSVRR